MKLLVFLFFGLVTINLFGQQQHVDVPPSGKENYRVYEGGSILVNINTETPLDSLIKKLDGDWNFLETGKGYWIGYTDNMFSIAARKDAAIQPLLHYINSSQNLHGKIGAVYCLHLIGINSTIVGRFQEKFVDKSAREALLSIAGREELTSVVVSLLARDPWESDLPTLSTILVENNINLTLINAMFRYTKKDFNFRENIPEDVDSICVFMKNSDIPIQIGNLITVYQEKKGDNPNKGNEMNQKGNVIVQWGEKGRIMRKFIPNHKEINSLISLFACNEKELYQSKCKKLNDLIYKLLLLSKEKVSVFSYCNFDEKYFHYVDENGITICSADQAKLRWIEYFNNK